MHPHWRCLGSRIEYRIARMKRASRDQGALDSLGHLCERSLAGVRDPHALAIPQDLIGKMLGRVTLGRGKAGLVPNGT
jgi:hypothetical protein